MAESPASGFPPPPDGTATGNTGTVQAGQAEREPRWVWLARIRRPQGRKGEVFADILTDFPEKFAERRRLWLLPEKPATAERTAFSPNIESPKPARALAPEGPIPARSPSAASPREIELMHHWLHKGGIVLHFSGIDSIGDAEKLAGLIVAIPLAERAALSEDETYIGDLIGCVLVDVAGPQPALVGEIEDVDRAAGPVALLVVRAKASAGEVLVPFAKSYLRKIDLEAKRVEMALPEGLIDLNAPENA